MTLSPRLRYHQKLKQAGFVDDAQQLMAVKALDDLFQQLVQDQGAEKQPTQAHGLYLWGDVGRGKTFLMDLFYESLPGGQKLRLHFHRFMARIHKELLLEAGNRDPLKRIARRIAKECKVLCFDEFFVSDIADAMILGGLFDALFEQGLILVATSNIAIEDLYKNGLQRQRFEPTIALLLKHTRQLHLDGEADHRLRHLERRQTYFLKEELDFDSLFVQLNAESDSHSQPLIIHGRTIEVIKAAKSSAWLNFDALCNGPRSQLDYIELAQRFDTILLSDVPLLGGEPRSWIRARGTEDGAIAIATGERQLSYAVNDDPTRRFISLIDELYDQGVNLYLSADVPMHDLYTGGALSFEFRRTLSRLTEMQSKEYLQD